MKRSKFLGLLSIFSAGISTFAIDTFDGFANAGAVDTTLGLNITRSFSGSGVSISSGSFGYNSGDAVNATRNMGYDIDVSGPLNLNNYGNAFRLMFSQVPNMGFTMNATVTDLSDTPYTLSALSVPNGANAFDIDFSGATNNLNQIKGVNFAFNTGHQSVDFGIDEIQAVPEPISMITMGAGLVGLLRRRRILKNS